MGKLNHVLHPELLLDRRGPEEWRFLLRKLVRGTQFHAEGWSVLSSACEERHPKGGSKALLTTGEIRPGRVEEPGWHYTTCPFSFAGELEHLDDTIRSAAAIYKKFLAESPKIYHVQRDFLLALSQVDRDIPLQFLPERFFGYISFAPQTLRDDTGWVEGAYCYIGDSKGTILNPEKAIEKVLWVVYTTSDGAVADLKVELKSDRLENLIRELPKQDCILKAETLSSSSATLSSITPDASANSRDLIYRTVLNAALYIHSQQPELRREPGSGDPALSKTQAREVRKKQQIPNECTVPVTFVNWGFERPRVFQVGETSVRGHFRWQPCGVGMQQVKLIWIDQHLRHYPTAEQQAPA
jgi:hypothetical protein